MVRDIFDANSIARLIGGMGVGHGEWSTGRGVWSGEFDILIL